MARIQIHLNNLENRVQDKNLRRKRTTLWPVRNTNNGVACYYCKKKGHIGKKCSLLRNKDKMHQGRNMVAKRGEFVVYAKDNQRMVQGHLGWSTIIYESCILVEAEINWIRSKRWLMRVHIDIDLKRVHNINTDEKRPALAESEQNVLNALLLYGKADCLIKLVKSQRWYSI